MHRDPDTSLASRVPDWLVGLVLAILVVTAGFAYLRSIGAGDDPAFEADSSEPESAATSFVLWDGTEATFDDFEGPLVVNFWASWCPACIAEMPDFEAVSNELGDQVTFIGMNLLPDDRAAAEQMVAQTGVTYQLALDDGGAIYSEFGGIAMPTTVFIGEDGSVVDVHSGAIFEEDLRDLIEELFGV